MAIRFRCQACAGLMSIASRKAGAMVQCPTCGELTLVPMEDVFEAASVAAVAPDGVTPDEEPGEILPLEIPPVEIPAVEAPPVDAMDEQSPDGQEPDKDSIEDNVDHDGPAIVLRRRSRTDDEMDLTPMVDVTFQLLIFFMVTASFALQKSIEVPTPDQDKKGAAQQLQMLEDIEATSIQVQIDANNAITIDDEAVSDSAQLPELLRDKMRKEQKTELMISSHAAAMHRSVIAVIDAANEVGMQKIRMVSRHAKSD